MKEPEPKDDENTMYIENGLYSSTSMEYILEKIQEKWPGASMEDIEVGIHRRIISSCACHPQDTEYEYYFEITRKKN